MNAVFKPVICVIIQILKTPYSFFSNDAFNDTDIAIVLMEEDKEPNTFLTPS